MKNTSRLIVFTAIILSLIYSFYIFSIITVGPETKDTKQSDLYANEVNPTKSQQVRTQSPAAKSEKTPDKHTNSTPIKDEANITEDNDLEIVLTAKEIEELISGEIKGKYSIEDLKIILGDDGKLDFSFEAGSIPGLELISKKHIAVKGSLENNPDLEYPYYNIESINIGALGVPKLFLKQAEDYINDTLVSELEQRFESSIETAYVSEGSIRIKVSEE